MGAVFVKGATMLVPTAVYACVGFGQACKGCYEFASAPDKALHLYGLA